LIDIQKYKYSIFLGIAVAVAAVCLPVSYISPILIIGLGLFLGLFLTTYNQKKLNDYIFLSGIFILAFLSRIIVGFLLYNFVFLSNGKGLLGDSLPYAENGYAILQMWLNGIRDFDYISICITNDANNTSGTVGSYDFWNAIVYFFAGKSPLSLIFINCLASSLTVVFIFFIAEQLFNKKTAIYTSILTAFWPSLFFWSVQNLKEPISVFLITALIWSILRLKKQFRFYLIFLVMLLSFALKEFRIVLFFVFFAIVFPLSLVLPFWKAKKVEFLFSLALFLFLGFLFFDVIKIYLVKILPSGDNVTLLDWIYTMRDYRAYGGSAFLKNWEFTNPLILVLFLPLALLVAWLAPFPWQCGSMLQIMAMPEMLLYYLLLPSMFLGCGFVMKHKVKEGGMILIYLFIMMLVLAFVEGNIGTLFRHRAMVLPFMFVLVGIGLEKIKFKITAHS